MLVSMLSDAVQLNVTYGPASVLFGGVVTLRLTSGGVVSQVEMIVRVVLC